MPKNIKDVMSGDTNPSNLDQMPRKDMDFEGGDGGSMPKMSPMPGADGKLPSKRVTKVRK